MALVEENVSVAQENVTEGARQLAAAARLSGGVAPVAGALLGGLVAGPLGLMVGAKVGSVAAVGGGVLGKRRRWFGERSVDCRCRYAREARGKRKRRRSCRGTFSRR